MRNFYISLACLCLISCTHKSGEYVGLVATPASKTIRDSIFLSIKGYGYDIIVNDSVIIHQPNIPGIESSSGFGSEEDARKIARLAISKIQRNLSGTDISLQDLQWAGILIYDYDSKTGLNKADF
jgi:hypothetical protein